MTSGAMDLDAALTQAAMGVAEKNEEVTTSSVQNELTQATNDLLASLYKPVTGATADTSVATGAVNTAVSGVDTMPMDAAATGGASAAAAPTPHTPTDLDRWMEAERNAAYYRGLVDSLQAGKVAPEEDASTPEYVYNPEDDRLTPEEALAYESARPVVEKMARTIAYQAFAKATEQTQHLAAELARVQQRLDAVSAQAALGSEAALLNAVQNRIGDLKSITQTKEWKTYLQQQAPFQGGRTIQEVMEGAVAARDAGTLIEAFETFKKQYQPQQAQQTQQTQQTQQETQARPAPAGHTGVPVGLAIPNSGADVGISASALSSLLDKRKKEDNIIDDAAYAALLDKLYAAAASGAPLVH